VIIAFSFNEPKGRFNAVWQKFTFDNWLHPFANRPLVDADDVVHTAAVAGHADYGGVRRFAGFRGQQISEDRNAGAALDDELLAAVLWEVAEFERLCVKRRAFLGETAD
jgi:hypothetical protein